MDFCFLAKETPENKKTKYSVNIRGFHNKHNAYLLSCKYTKENNMEFSKEKLEKSSRLLYDAEKGVAFCV